MKKVALGSIAALLALFAVLLFRAPPGPRSLRAFAPDRTAQLELEMWQAYYQKEKPRLFVLLATLMHEQYRYSWAKAISAALHLARAAATFGDARSGYERVLPDLEDAYRIARDWTSAGFDPRDVARAELAWWVARRIPEERSAENVGRLIAAEYALLYETRADRVLEAGRLRAEAGALRDEGGAAADWPRVAALLQESYRSLHAAVSAPEEVRHR